jgi:SAM-dependent methyltransferase
MDTNVLNFVKKLNLNENEKVLEVGSLNINGTVRSVIKNKNYIGIDAVAGNGVDVVMDLFDIDIKFEVGSFDIVVSCELLEHVEDWFGAIQKMWKMLRPQGQLVLTTRRPGFGYHAYPNDFWRFTTSDLKKAFKKQYCLIEDLDNFGIGCLVIKTTESIDNNKFSIDSFIKPYP